MEDIPKNLDKEISLLAGSKPRKRSSRWMLLFVKDSGRIISLRNFKGLMILWVVLLLAGGIVSSVFYFLLRQSHHEMDRLRNELGRVRQEAEVIRNEKDRLAVRLAMVESRKAAAPTASKNKEKAAIDAAAVVPEAPAAEGPKTVTTDAAHAEDPPPVEGIEPKTEKAAAAEPPAESALVDIEAFKLTFDADVKRYRVQYKIRNIDPGPGPVSGYTFVMLTDGESTPEDPLILPDVKMISGKPSAVKSGRHFSIQRFKTVRFDTLEIETPRAITGATVLVYGTNGKLMLEKHFELGDGSEDTDNGDG